ncbi:hydroxyethylthiazole kinase [Lachnospiraceae bacterium 54-53]
MNRQLLSLTGLVREKQPLIHCITNYVTAGDVANIILACGGSPIMADHPEEAAEVTAMADCLLLNKGTPKESSPAAMLKAGSEANRLNHPVILDPVGIGVSRYRTMAVLSLLKEVKVTVIRGNASELRFLLNALTGPGNEEDLSSAPAGNTERALSRGVDASFSDQMTEKTLAALTETARALSAMTGAVTVMTGTTDIVSTWKETWLIKNGSPWLTRITGSGCMLDGIIASYTAAAAGAAGSAAPRRVLFEAAALATAAAGLCGERAAKKTEEIHGGTGSFLCCFLNEVSCLEEHILKGGINIEIP